MTTYEKIRLLCEKEGFPISSIGQKIPHLKVDKSAVSGWKKGARPRPDKIKAISDYFGVPVDYLQDDNSLNIKTVNDNHGIIGNLHAPLNFQEENEISLSDQDRELLRIFAKLSIVDRAKVLAFADELLNS